MSKSTISVMFAFTLAVLCVPALTGKKPLPAGPTGRDIYLDRCGACHGEDGEGSGPAVGSLKIAPSNLTLLAQRNGGVFPVERVKNIVGDWVDIGAHGSREMPIWGSLFHPKSPADQQAADEQFKKMVDYLASIQR